MWASAINAHVTVTCSMRRRIGTRMHSDTNTTLDDAAHATSATQYGMTCTVRRHRVSAGHCVAPRKFTYTTKAVGSRKPAARFSESRQKATASKYTSTHSSAKMLLSPSTGARACVAHTSTVLRSISTSSGK